MYFLLEIQMYDQEVYEKCKFKKKKNLYNQQNWQDGWI